MPVYWAEETGAIPDNLASSFVTTVYGAQRLAFGIQTAGMVVGAVFAILAAILFTLAASTAVNEATKAKMGGPLTVGPN